MIIRWIESKIYESFVQKQTQIENKLLKKSVSLCAISWILFVLQVWSKTI